MAQRFIDTNFYKSPFVRGLEGAMKGLYHFIICDCTGAGIWSKDLQIASAYIGFNVTEEKFHKNFVLTNKAIDLKNGKYFIPSFIEHQYPSGLQENNKAHKNFIIELNKYGLLDEELNVITFEQQVEFTPTPTKATPKTVTEDFEIIFPYNSVDFMNIWNLLIKESKWKKKSKTALQASLAKLSKYSEQDAIAIMSEAIANNYQGLFETTEIKNRNHQNGKINSKQFANDRTDEAIRKFADQ